jgi:hypothetical protein
MAKSFEKTDKKDDGDNDMKILSGRGTMTAPLSGSLI